MNKYTTIDDLIIFGSAVKGSSDPKDLDIALLLKDERELIQIKEDVRAISKDVDIQIVNSIYSTIWPVLMREGFSVRKEAFLHDLYKLTPITLYKYSLKKLNPIQKVQFTRGLKKALSDTKAKILSRSVVIVPIEKKAGFDEFLSTWNLTYDTQSYELFPFMRKNDFE